MPNMTEFSHQVKLTLSETVHQLISQLPGISGALILLLVGWLLARLVRTATVKGL